jgi:tetratricopeptide (TPR) repeat protein
VGTQQVRGTWRAGSAGGPWWGRVRRCRAHLLVSCKHDYSALLTTQRKSQLAIQYAHRVRDATPRTYVFWVHASTRARFEEAYRGLAERLELPGRLDPTTDVLRLVSNWLCDEANGQWTMVIDNVDDVETFFPTRRREQDATVESSAAPLAAYIPQSRNGSILITARSKDAAARLAGGYHNIKEVQAMGVSQALQLLHNKLAGVSYEEGAAAEELVRTLDCMPLVITQAAAYINRRARMTIAGYLSELRASDKRRKSLLHQDADDLRRDESASNSVVTTWQISFGRVRRERPSAAELLSLMSFFNPQEIPERTLRRCNRTTAMVGALDHRNKADRMFDEDLDTLHRYSLITLTTTTTTTDGATWEMHALVQFCTQLWLSKSSDPERLKGEFLKLMAQEFPTGEFETWKQCEQLFPHIEPLFDTEPSSEEPLLAWTEVLTNAAWYLYEKGSYPLAQAVATKAMKARERVLGLDNNQTLISVNILASVLNAQGKYEDSEKLGRRALEGREKLLGIHHPDTLSSVSNLASALYSQGKYEEAEKLDRRVLEVREKELGIHHPDTLISVSNLASVLSSQGKYEEAKKLYQRALEGQEKELGIHHLDTLRSVTNLAVLLRTQGKYEEAEKLDWRVLEGREKELGIHHPDTLKSVYNLAYLLHTIGRYAEAVELYQRAYDGFVQKLGPQHPNTIYCGNDFSALQREAIAENSRQGDN